MASLKKLASQTAYYGLSSILGRMLNYALVPLHTRVLQDQQDYGVLGELYAYASFLNILFLYGMETSFFRFASKHNDLKGYYSNVFGSVLISSILFTSTLIFFAQPILSVLQAGSSSAATLYNTDYIIYFALIIGIDAISAIPFARLRLENRPLKFASIRVANILINVLLNVYFLLVCPVIFKENPNSFLVAFYNPDFVLQYVFLSNLIASTATILFLYKEIIDTQIRLQWSKLKPLLVYGFPLLFAGLAGMTNETLDRILLKYYLPGTLEERLAQIGVYNAAYKLSIFMTLAIQAFRMAAEPFFFSMYKDENAQKVYARVMNYFVMACAFIFLAVSLHLHILEYLLGASYREGMYIVPVLLFANLFLGIYLNLSIWFKLNEQTWYGLVFTLIGAFFTVTLNIYLIPKFGYTGSAYATLVSYFMMTLGCYIVGQRKYPIPYNLKKIVFYIVLMLTLFQLSRWNDYFLFGHNFLTFQFINSSLLIVFVLIVFILERKSLNLKIKE